MSLFDELERPMSGALVTSARQTWNTPADVLDEIRRFDAIGLDPCSNPQSIVGAATEWQLERDGDSLARDWRGHGLVYCNPPYSRWLKRWMAKCSTAGCEVISLTPARTDTVAWHSYAVTCDAVCFWRGRMRFLGAAASAPFPSALCYWGDRIDRFVEVFGRVGIVNVSAHRFKAAVVSRQMGLDISVVPT